MAASKNTSDVRTLATRDFNERVDQVVARGVDRLHAELEVMNTHPLLAAAYQAEQRGVTHDSE